MIEKLKTYKMRISKPLVEDKTKGNIKNSTQTERLAPSPPPVLINKTKTTINYEAISN